MHDDDTRDVVDGPTTHSCCFACHNHRFLVLEHSVLLVYASEDDWAEHREPLDDLTLSHDSAVELVQEGGEVRYGCRAAEYTTKTLK